MILFKRYEICLLDLVCDGNPPTLSTTKIWTHIGYTILSYCLLQHVQQGNELTPELVISYGGVVACHHILIYWLKKKYGVTTNEPTGAAGSTQG
jgi:hypothetical protein